MGVDRPSYRYYVSRPLITRDQSERSPGPRIPAAKIEQLVTSRVRQWLLDPASIYQATRFSNASAQRRVLARAAELARSGPSCQEHASVPSFPPSSGASTLEPSKSKRQSKLVRCFSKIFGPLIYTAPENRWQMFNSGPYVQNAARRGR